MEEQYEAIDKIINKVLETNLATATGHVVTLLREVAIAALEQGYKNGYELGYDDGSSIGHFESKAD
jgi:hypothetical protein